MTRIFDNIEHDLLPALRETLAVSERSDFRVGYFNLRGWGRLDKPIDKWSGGQDHCCRLLVGMQKLPQEEMRGAMSLLEDNGVVDAKAVVQFKKQMAMKLRDNF